MTVIFPNFMNNGYFSIKYQSCKLYDITIILAINLTIILVENEGFWYELTVILKNIGHFGNHSTYSVITVTLVQKTGILPQWFWSRIYWINGHFGVSKMTIAQNSRYNGCFGIWQRSVWQQLPIL